MIHLHHVHLFSQDLDATVAWYRRAFDAEVYYDGDFDGSRNVFMRIGAGRIHFYSQPPRDNGKGAIHHIEIRTNDLVGLRDCHFPRQSTQIFPCYLSYLAVARKTTKFVSWQLV